jgi:hypothetical protein
MKRVKAIGEISLSALEDARQREATAAAVAAGRGVIHVDGPIGPLTPIGRLSETEWGWIVAAILFGWIAKRAEQAAVEELDTERTIRMLALDPCAWDTGAVAAILPELADACSEIDWAQPITAWPRETVVEFLLTAMRLIRRAMIARDLSEKGITRKSSADVIARQTNAAAGCPLLAPDELNDEIEL